MSDTGRLPKMIHECKACWAVEGLPPFMKTAVMTQPSRKEQLVKEVKFLITEVQTTPAVQTCPPELLPALHLVEKRTVTELRSLHSKLKKKVKQGAHPADPLSQGHKSLAEWSAEAKKHGLEVEHIGEMMTNLREHWEEQVSLAEARKWASGQTHAEEEFEEIPVPEDDDDIIKIPIPKKVHFNAEETPVPGFKKGAGYNMEIDKNGQKRREAETGQQVASSSSSSLQK